MGIHVLSLGALASPIRILTFHFIASHFIIRLCKGNGFQILERNVCLKIPVLCLLSMASIREKIKFQHLIFPSLLSTLIIWHGSHPHSVSHTQRGQKMCLLVSTLMAIGMRVLELEGKVNCPQPHIKHAKEDLLWLLWKRSQRRSV